MRPLYTVIKNGKKQKARPSDDDEWMMQTKRKKEGRVSLKIPRGDIDGVGEVKREGWVLLKIPRGDIDGVGEVK